MPFEVGVGTDEISERVRNFVSRYFESVSELEVLLLLAKQDQRSWTAAEVCAFLRGNETSTARQLTKLHLAGLLQCEQGATPTFRYAPNEPGLREAVQETLEAYSRFRHRVIRMLYDRPGEQMKAFVKSFRLRGDEDA